jgi:HPt (histidine-containing phosphotransfer) domain-containing protein
MLNATGHPTIDPATAATAASPLPIIDRTAEAAWREDLAADDIAHVLETARREALKGAAEIKALTAKGDLPGVRRTAHKIKGMAGNLGAARLAQLLREIEHGAAAGNDVAHVVLRLDAAVHETLKAFAIPG